MYLREISIKYFYVINNIVDELIAIQNSHKHYIPSFDSLPHIGQITASFRLFGRLNSIFE